MPNSIPRRIGVSRLVQQAERNLEEKVVKQLVLSRKKSLMNYLPLNQHSLRLQHPSVMKRLDKILFVNPTSINAYNKIDASFNKMEQDIVNAISSAPRSKPTNSSLGAYWTAKNRRRVSVPPRKKNI
jgi:hypothetical protein